MTEKYEFKVSGDELVAKVKQLIHEGNIRHLPCSVGCYTIKPGAPSKR